MDNDNIFRKIIRKEIPAQIVFENEEVLAFKDISPQAPIHILIIPKKIATNVMDATPEILTALMIAAQEIATAMGIDKEGFRLVTNIGENGGQTVPHLHFHLLGGRPLTWPPG